MLSELTSCSSQIREQQDFRKIYYLLAWSEAGEILSTWAPEHV